MMQSQQETQDAQAPRPIQVAVNEQPMIVQGPRTTGLEIKEAAIEQGVEMGLDFILSKELGKGRTKIIGNDDPVTVHKGSRFVAIPNDDNS